MSFYYYPLPLFLLLHFFRFSLFQMFGALFEFLVFISFLSFEISNVHRMCYAKYLSRPHINGLNCLGIFDVKILSFELLPFKSLFCKYGSLICFSRMKFCFMQIDFTFANLSIILNTYIFVR